MSRDQKLKLVAHSYFVCLNKLAFLIEDKHALLSTGVGMNVHELYINSSFI